MTVMETVQDFCDNTDFYERGGQRLVGESPDFGIRVIVCGFPEEDGIYPEVVVWADDDLWFDEILYTKEDFAECLEKVFEDYLTPNVIEKIAQEVPEKADPPDELTLDEQEVYAREEEIHNAVRDFLKVVYQCDYFEGVPDEDYMDVLSDIEDALLDTLSFYDDDIYRPTIREDENGEVGVVSFPYSDEGIE